MNNKLCSLILACAFVGASVFMMGCVSTSHGQCTNIQSTNNSPQMVQVVNTTPLLGQPLATNCDIKFVGPQGPQGPTGPVGSVGEIGATGPLGPRLLGAAGIKGPVGDVGPQGQQGPQGPQGGFAVGPLGPVGPQGAVGVQGEAGPQGPIGSSYAAARGIVGPKGPRGPQGPSGEIGPIGPTTVGPTGLAGEVGPQGPQGPIGPIGVKGPSAVGIAGIVGPAGDAGAVGPQGPIGPQGTVGSIECWNYYRDFVFASNDATNLLNSDTSKLSEMATYLAANPTFVVGINATVVPANNALSDKRATSVQNALVNAGVPQTKIQIGSFSDSNHAYPQDGRVVVFIKSTN